MTSTPVFVDASGRRARLVAAACWALGCVFGGYVLLVAAALVLPAGTLSLTVPGLGPVLPKTLAPDLTTVPGRGGPPASVLTHSTPPTPRTSSSSPVAGRTSAPGTTTTPTPVGPPTGRPGNRPTASPTVLPTPTSVHSSGRATSHPTPSHPTPNPRASKTPHAHP